MERLDVHHLSDCHLFILFFCLSFKLSPKASLTVSLSVKARNATVTVTVRSPSETPRSATARSLLIGETEIETKTKGTARWSNCPTDATVKIEAP